MTILRGLSLLALALPATAHAAWPDDVSLSALGTVQGQPVADTAASRAAYETVVRELGTAIANQPMAPAETLGLSGFTEPATVMPVQIYIWSSSAERAFEARTAAAILALLTLLVSFNAVAIYLRRRFERRW